MNTGAAIAIAAGALVLVFVLTKKQEQQTAMRASNIINAKQNDTLTGGDTVVGVAAGVAGYFGGAPAAGAVLRVSGKSL